MEAIKTEGLTKCYGKNRGITNLNLSVNEGEFFGFIGPNGAGKSTTIRTLLGLISATEGTARVLGQTIGTGKPEILSRIGYMPSEAMFYNGMRVRDCLRFSADLRKKDCREEAERLCQRLELDTTRKVSELSLGNRKKVSIVCALQHKPDLYILDEPTSGLDPLIQKEFFSLLQERNKEGATVFFSSHVLSEVQNYCGRAAVIKEGRLVACDKIENLRNTSAKRVSLRFLPGSPEIPQPSAENLLQAGGFSPKDIADIRRADDSLSFLYNGEVNTLLKYLASLSLADINIDEPDLEEIFLHYYEKGDDTQ